MVTKNFKTLMMLILQSNSNSVVKGMQPVVNVLGNTYYAANQVYDSMPSGTNTNFNLDASGTGISVGSGNTAATENDYQLETPITSGLTCAMVKQCDVDENGNPYLRFTMMMLNTSNASITIKEIGYKQNLRCTDAQFGTSTTYRTCLLDRTVLGTSITIAPDDYEVIQYTLKTVISAGE